jgi:hypothetical protein
MASDKITSFGDGGMVLTGRGVDVFRAYTIARSLVLYERQRLEGGGSRLVNRGYTPKAMMQVAKDITGKKFAARDYLGAAEALIKWADEVSQSIKNKE